MRHYPNPSISCLSPTSRLPSSLAFLLLALVLFCFLLSLSGCVSVEPPALKISSQVQAAINSVPPPAEVFAGASTLRLASISVFLFGAFVSVVMSALRREFCLHSLAVGFIAGLVGLFIPVILSVTETLLSWTLVGTGFAIVITVSVILYKRHVSINSSI